MMKYALKEYIRAATWVVCPVCDKKNCVGILKCPEIARLLEKIDELKEDKERENCGGIG